MHTHMWKGRKARSSRHEGQLRVWFPPIRAFRVQISSSGLFNAHSKELFYACVLKESELTGTRRQRSWTSLRASVYDWTLLDSTSLYLLYLFDYSLFYFVFFSFIISFFKNENLHLKDFTFLIDFGFCNFTLFYFILFTLFYFTLFNFILLCSSLLFILFYFILLPWLFSFFNLILFCFTLLYFTLSYFTLLTLLFLSILFDFFYLTLVYSTYLYFIWFCFTLPTFTLFYFISCTNHCIQIVSLKTFKEDLFLSFLPRLHSTGSPGLITNHSHI